MMLPEGFVKKLLKKWLDFVADDNEEKCFMIGLLYGCSASWLAFAALLYILGCGA